MVCRRRTAGCGRPPAKYIMEKREALIIINALPEMGPVRLRSLLEHYPDPVDALNAPLEKLERVPRLGTRCAAMLHDWQQHFDLGQEMRLLQQAGVQLLTMEDDNYPSALREIHDPPVCLYLRGSSAALGNCSRSVAMVGSRFATGYGRKMARQLTQGAVAAGWTVVSGLARGIDAVCHETAVESGGCTVAVLGSGFLHLYPRENAGLAQRIAESGGAFVSEFPMNAQPARCHFPMRNRIISGLCCGTVVVEAGLNSGSIITATQAVEQGRTVFAVPGNADTPFSRGCNALIRDGARLIESFSDILDEFSTLPSVSEQRRERAETQLRESPPVEIPVSDAEWRMWQEIGENGCGVDDLVVRSGESTASVLGTLLLLEIKQLIEQLPGKRLRRCARRTAVPEKPER